MTVVVALSCQEGIVLASDSQETSGQTRDMVQKLHDVGGRLAWGAAGGAGMIDKLQSYTALLEGHLDESWLEVRDRIVALVGTVQRAGLEEFVPLPNIQPPYLEALFCWCDAEGVEWILHVTPDGAGSSFRDYQAAIGSGGPFGQVALASVGHLATYSMDMERLKMVAYKAVQDVIVTSAWGVGWPVQMYTVTPGEGAVRLSDDEVDAVRDAVGAWMEIQRESLGELVQSPADVEALEETAAEPPEADAEADVGIEPRAAEE